MTSADYDANHALTQTFFATVQNKVHYAIHGQTAAELIAPQEAAVMDFRIAHAGGVHHDRVQDEVMKVFRVA